ncbi:DUF2851 family protein [Chitinophaga agri]|uniref:DUF2851 family protein n=1 Tax=Chitinophaga agri TaxID=2703787 RepID=A0A6B9ZK10_9BACT|nr:DUF2851 family protein [Chitinophaga agri]QHS62770.1 DUF2851 family protein [Chitinophaga agri]
MTIVNVDPFMSEELFQHIWQFRLFTQSGLTTLEGDPVQIDHTGQLNRHAGPDFTGARIRIGTTLWVGNVEMHLKTSDWFRHGHQYNLQYRNVVLHVVFEHDMEGVSTHGIPVLQLQHCIPRLLLQRYKGLWQSAAYVPCAGSVQEVSSLVWTGWKDRLLIERLEQKTVLFRSWLVQTQYNWEEVCYRALARGAGSPVNGEVFLALAHSLPYKLLLRHQHDQGQLEALLFGQAGMLGMGRRAGDDIRQGDVIGGMPPDKRRNLGEDEVDLMVSNGCLSIDKGVCGKQVLPGITDIDTGTTSREKSRIIPDDYMVYLQREYAYLRHKYKLAPLDEQRWKWLRMRPASFPSMKIAAMAALLHHQRRLFSAMLDAPDVKHLESMLSVSPSDYWKTHYRFGKPVRRTSMPGRTAVHNMLINTVLPLLYMYGKEKKDAVFQEKIISFMGQLPAEDNHVMRAWKALHINAGSAGETQALLQLKQAYCEQKRCLQCAIGAKLLRSGIA